MRWTQTRSAFLATGENRGRKPGENRLKMGGKPGEGKRPVPLSAFPRRCGGALALAADNFGTRLRDSVDCP